MGSCTSALEKLYSASAIVDALMSRLESGGEGVTMSVLFESLRDACNRMLSAVDTVLTGGRDARCLIEFRRVFVKSLRDVLRLNCGVAGSAKRAVSEFLRENVRECSFCQRIVSRLEELEKRACKLSGRGGFLERLFDFAREELVREFGEEVGARVILDELRDLRDRLESSCSILGAVYAYLKTLIERLRDGGVAGLSGDTLKLWEL